MCKFLFNLFNLSLQKIMRLLFFCFLFFFNLGYYESGFFGCAKREKDPRKRLWGAKLSFWSTTTPYSEKIILEKIISEKIIFGPRKGPPLKYNGAIRKNKKTKGITVKIFSLFGPEKGTLPYTLNSEKSFLYTLIPLRGEKRLPDTTYKTCTPITLYPLRKERLFFGKRKDLYPYTP